MARFLTFETTALKINNSVFPCNSISISLNANTVPVFDINGNLLYYSPAAPVEGKFSTSFYLTGALPNFLKLENQTETPVRLAFNQFYIPSAYLTDLNFSVEPFQPVSVNTSFNFYHGLTVLNTDLNDVHQSFSNSLKTLNGLSSYIVATNRDTYSQNPNDFIITNFNYAFSVERSPVLRIKESVPSRVALKKINAEFQITANNLDGKLKIKGNSGIFNAFLKDNENLSTFTDFSLTGIIVDQNYSMSENSYGTSTIKMIQNINPKRNTVSIPFEIENFDIAIPEFIIDEPNEVPLPEEDDPLIDSGGSAQIENPVVQDKFYVFTQVYLQYPNAFLKGTHDKNCELLNDIFKNLLLDVPQGVAFEQANFPIKLDFGANDPPTVSDAGGPPYYYVGRFKIDKEFLKNKSSDSVMWNIFWNDFTGHLEVKKYNSVTQTYESMGNQFSFTTIMDNYGGDPGSCSLGVIQPNSFYARVWSDFNNDIVPMSNGNLDQNILNLKQDTFLNPLVFEEGDGP